MKIEYKVSFTKEDWEKLKNTKSYSELCDAMHDQFDANCCVCPFNLDFAPQNVDKDEYLRLAKDWIKMRVE